MGLVTVRSKKRKLAAFAAGIFFIAHNTAEPKKRQVWEKSWVSERRKFGHMKLLKHLRENNPRDFHNYLRMNEEDFDVLLAKVAQKLTKQDTVMRKSIPPTERLIVTLRFLATGNSYEDLKFTSGIAAQTLGYLIPETCQVIWEELKDEYMKMPQTSDEWLKEARIFKERWQIVNCGGSIDGKHIRIVQPPRSGALYYNYKKFYSVVLMAIVNANYEFIYVDVGKQGRMSDGGVMEYTTFHDRLRNGSLNLPNNDETDEHLNYIFVADEAFGLDPHIMKPYAQKELTPEKRIFNYRLSRPRNVVENAFGLITSRFRVLHSEIHMKPEIVNYVVLAVCVLHNFLIRRSSSYFRPSLVDRSNSANGEIIPGSWREECEGIFHLEGMQRVARNPSLAAKENRDRYLAFFNGKGAVSWQNDMVNKGKA